MKNRISLTESQLHRVIKESIKRLLKESEGVTAYGILKKDGTLFRNLVWYRETLAEWICYNDVGHGAKVVKVTFDPNGANSIFSMGSMQSDWMMML